MFTILFVYVEKSLFCVVIKKTTSNFRKYSLFFIILCKKCSKASYLSWKLNFFGTNCLPNVGTGLETI